MIAAIAILYYELCSQHIIYCIIIINKYATCDDRVVLSFVQETADINNNCRLKMILIFLPRLQAKATHSVVTHISIIINIILIIDTYHFTSYY